MYACMHVCMLEVTLCIAFQCIEDKWMQWSWNVLFFMDCNAML